MEFGCRYLYVDQSRSQCDIHLHSHPDSVTASEKQNGVVESDPAFYDNPNWDKELRADVKVNELPQEESKANRAFQESNVSQSLEPASSTNLDQKTPPLIPDRKKKPSVYRDSELPQEESKANRAFQESNVCQSLEPASSTNLDQKTPPLIPDRKKKTSVYRDSELPQEKSTANRAFRESNVYQGLQLASSANLDQKTPPPIPAHRKPSVYQESGLPQESGHGTVFLESNVFQDFQPAPFTDLKQQKRPPPIPDRKKKPSVFRQSGITNSNTPVYDSATHEEVPKPDLQLNGVNKSDTPVYDYATYKEVPKPDLQFNCVTKSEIPIYDYATCEELSELNLKHNNVPQICPAANMPLKDNYYLDVLPALASELEMQRTPPRPPDRPITPLPAPCVERLPANCNILLLNIGKMVDDSDNQSLQPPLLCCNCSAAFSELNHVEDNKTWSCVFCATENPMTGDNGYESRAGGDQLYIRDSQPGNEYSFAQDTMLIFCIDISGSMSVTTEVVQNQSYECNNVRLYQSRMEAVKSALSQTLNFLHQQHPSKRVALVTFSDQVKIYGDGTIQPQVLEDSELLDPDYLKSQGENQPVPQTLEETLPVLEAKIQCLQESGVTALGPAALVSIAMASKRPGSKVIICTDGRANTDLGNLENIAEEYAYQSSKLYYSNLEDLALQHSVVISVVTIEGTDCRLPELGQLADKTGGKVNIVHPLNLANEFQSIVEEEINATDVKVKVYLPHSMHFLYEGHTEPLLERTFGSTTLDTVLSTEFDVDSLKIKEVLRYSQLPIQVQLAFTLPDGRGRYRILSQKRPVTNDSTTVLESINLSVLQNHSVQFSARLAMEGHVNEARKVALELKELIDQVMRHEKYEDQGVVYEDWEYSMAPIYEDLQVYVQEKSSKRNGEDSHAEGSVVKTFSDEMAKMIFHMKRAKRRVLHRLKHQAE